MGVHNLETSILLQIRHRYIGNLNSEMCGDSKTVFLHCGDVFWCSLCHVHRSTACLAGAW